MASVAAVNAMNDMLNGKSEEELKTEIKKLVAADVVKDFRKTAGPDYFSGKAGGDLGETLTDFINWKTRVKGALRRANYSYRFLFTNTKNCDLSTIHVSNIPV